MTSKIVLSTAWQEIAVSGTVLASFELDGDAIITFGTSVPSVDADGHPVEDGTKINSVLDASIYARLSGDDDIGVVYVDVFTETKSFTAGLSLIHVAPTVNLVTL